MLTFYVIALSVLLKKVSNNGDEIITIGIDGTLHYKHPAFDYYMRQQIKRMFGNKVDRIGLKKNTKKIYYFFQV